MRELEGWREGERERLRGGIIERERWRDRDNAIEGKKQRERWKDLRRKRN